MTDFRRFSDDELRVGFVKAFFDAGEFAGEMLRRERGDIDWNGFLADHPEIARRPWEQVVDQLRFGSIVRERLEAIRQVAER
jgi:hypothetical protein